MPRYSIAWSSVVIGVVGLIMQGAPSAVAQGTSQAPAPLRKVDVTVTVLEVRSIEAASPGDLFARVTIAGDTSRTRVAPKPNLRVTMSVPEGTLVPVRLELFDKIQVAYADQVDINQIPGKRDLDFVVDPAKCAISGFSQEYKCSDVIKRVGLDSKPGEISFRVDVLR